MRLSFSSFKTCREAGRAAFGAFVVRALCPYAVGNVERVWWLRGWQEGYEAVVDLPLAEQVEMEVGWEIVAQTGFKNLLAGGLAA